MTTGGRSLIVMRHATAAPYAAEDQLRALTGKGELEASAAGAWLAEYDLVPDVVWVSSTVRSQRTWDLARAAAGFDVEAQVEPSLYSAGPESVIDLLHTLPARARTVLLVGHNPTAAYLTHLLDDGHPDAEAWAKVSEGFPPAARAVLDVEVEWADLSVATAHLRLFQTGTDSL